MREGRSMAGTWKLHHDASGVYGSLIPGFSPPGVFEHFRYANTKQKTLEISPCVVMLGGRKEVYTGRDHVRSQVNTDHSAGYQTKSCIDTAL